MTSGAVTSNELQDLTDRFVTGGIAGIENRLDECPSDGDQRLVLLNSVRKAIDAIYIEKKLLDRMHEIYDACIAESLAIANGDEELIAYANVTSYNLAANLADCWTDAEEARYPQHFRAGVDAAKRCLKLRRQLQKPPAAMAMAYFILGVHEYSLQHYSNAEQAWLNKLENEVDSKLPRQEQTFQDKDDLNILLSRGLIGLARWSASAENDSNYNESISRLEAKRCAANDKEVDLFVNELTLLKLKHGPCAG